LSSASIRALTPGSASIAAVIPTPALDTYPSGFTRTALGL
jgi:hypothetical protein